MVQDLMNKKEIEFSKLEGESIIVITGTTYSRIPAPNGPRPIIIFHDNKPLKDKVPKSPKLVLFMEVPRPFPYKSEKMVP